MNKKQKKNDFIFSRVGFAIISTLGVSSGLRAQVPELVSAQPSAGVEEIVVTAQKRAENLQDVPIAISAFKADTLKAAGVKTLDDINVVTPGVNFTRALGTPSPFIRGIGNAQTSGGQENSTSIYVDGVYLTQSNGLLFSFNNIDRIEVLKGPQGTLFGRNATGGLVNIITRTPSSDPSVEGSIGYGNFQQVDATLYGTTGFGDKVAADLAVSYGNQGKGYGINLATGNEVSKTKSFGVRSKLLLTPGDDTTITLSGDYERLSTSFGLNRQPPPGSLSPISGTPYTGSTRNVNSDVDPDGQFRQGGGSVRIEQNLSWAKLMSLSAYRHGIAAQFLDQDAGAFRLAASELRDTDSTFTQEVQISSPSSSKLIWIAGAFYIHSNAALSPLMVRGANNQDTFTQQDLRSISAFAQATYEIFQSTNLTIGGRYTSDKRLFHDAFVVNPLTGVVTSRMAGLPASAKSSKPTWRFSLDHKFSDQILGYISYNRGFKGAVFNATDRNALAVKPEILDAFEAGLKTDALDRRLRLNLSGYYYKYRNLQVQQVRPVGTALVNAGAARIYGGELEATAVPVANLTFHAGLTVTHARYLDFPGVQTFTRRTVAPFGLIQTIGDASGNHLLRTPDWTANLSADYTVPTSVGNFGANISYYYNDGFFWEAENRGRQSAYSLVNAELRWHMSDERWGVRLWAKNLLDKSYFVNYSSSTAGETATGAAPRTYGAAIDFKF